MNPLNVFVSWDGDSIGQRVGRATLSDDVEEVRRVDQAIQAGNEVWKSWALRFGGSIVEIGGDEGRVEVPAAALGELPQVSETYKTAVKATVSVGVGRKLSESAKALLAAKLRGKNRVVLYDRSVEEELAHAEDKPEEKKIAEEYLDEPANGVPTAELFEKAEGAGAGVTHAKAPSRQGSDHEEGEVAHAEDHKPVRTETSADAREHLARAHDHAGAQERRDRAATARQSGDLAQLRGQVAQSLTAMQQQLPVMSQLKSAYPQTYQAVLGLMQSVIKMGQELQRADESLEKAETEGPAAPAPTELEAWASTWHEPLAKFQNTIHFPGLGVERRTDTPTVHTSAQHALRLGLIGADDRRALASEIEQKGGAARFGQAQITAHLGAQRAASQKEMQVAAKRRTAHPGHRGQVAVGGGGARPSFAVGGGLMGTVKSKKVTAAAFEPKSEDATVMHENFHHVMNRVDEQYGKDASKHLSHWLIHQIPRQHLSLLLHHATTFFKYKTNNPRLAEESIALLHNYLNNPAARKGFLDNRRATAEAMAGKKMTLEEAHAHDRGIDQMMKQAYHGIRRAAATMTPERLQEIVRQRSGNAYGWTKAELEEIDKGLLNETEAEPDEAPAEGPDLDKAAGVLPDGSGFFTATVGTKKAEVSAHAPERMTPMPVGTTYNGKVKVQHADGSAGWKGVRAGEIQGQEADAPMMGANSHPVSSREPGSK